MYDKNKYLNNIKIQNHMIVSNQKSTEKEDIMKKVLLSLLVMFLSVTLISPSVSALETNNLSNKEYYDENGNYYNPETGEYFIWNQNSRSTAKPFSFKFQYTLTSSNFKLNTSRVKINVYNAHFEYGSGTDTSCCNDHHFEVDLRRDQLILPTHNIADFYAPFSSASVDLGSGFSTDAEYFIEINNVDGLDEGVYLVGNGEVYCY